MFNTGERIQCRETVRISMSGAYVVSGAIGTVVRDDMDGTVLVKFDRQSDIHATSEDIKHGMKDTVFMAYTWFTVLERNEKEKLS